MAHRKTAATILCLVVLSSAAILLPAYRQKARQRKLAQDAAQYRAAAAHGDADAQYRLGSISYYGQGAPQDYTEAVRWYRKAAGQGSAVAQYALAYCYFHGRGVSQDSAEAVRWLRKAADQGYVAAENRLGDMYARGDGLPRDYVEAVRWSRKAAAQGDAGSQRYLGRAYHWGQGVPQSYTEAVHWYRKAAEQGDAPAQWYLARAYRLGQGAARDYIQATRWYLKFFGQTTLRCARRLGWTPLAVLLAALVCILVPERCWGRARWLSWALLSSACVAQVTHLLSGSPFTGWVRVLDIVLFATLSVMTALIAIAGAMHDRKTPAHPAAG